MTSKRKHSEFDPLGRFQGKIITALSEVEYKGTTVEPMLTQLTGPGNEYLLWVEFLRFLLLRIRFKDFPLSPSARVDSIWHHCILSTRMYQGICTALGEFVHHDHRALDDTDEKRNERRSMMRNLYVIAFGCLPIFEDPDLSPQDEVKLMKIKEITALSPPMTYKYPDGKVYTLRDAWSYTIGELKMHIALDRDSDMDSLRIYSGNMQLEDSQTLADYNIQCGSQLHVIYRLRGC